MRKRRSAGVNTKLIMDVIFASLIVQKAPALINQFIKLDPAISNIAGIGAGYITGIMTKRPYITNAALALGATGFIEPIFDNLLGTVTTPLLNVPGMPRGIATTKIKGAPLKTMADYTNLNDYIENPGVNQYFDEYANSY